MTDTRKAIIGIIEPYMDKTLSEGCVIKTAFGRFHTMVSKEHFIDLVPYKEWLIWLNWQEDILGHYDITAVLKFLDIVWRQDSRIKEFWDLDISIYEGYIRILPQINIEYANNPQEQYEKWFIFETYIPNKPLHLFSETEEQELLELLLKLK